MLLTEQNDAAGLQDIGFMGDFQRQTGILLDHEDRLLLDGSAR